MQTFLQSLENDVLCFKIPLSHSQQLPSPAGLVLLMENTKNTLSLTPEILFSVSHHSSWNFANWGICNTDLKINSRQVWNHNIENPNHISSWGGQNSLMLKATEESKTFFIPFSLKSIRVGFMKLMIQIQDQVAMRIIDATSQHCHTNTSTPLGLKTWFFLDDKTPSTWGSFKPSWD